MHINRLKKASKTLAEIEALNTKLQELSDFAAVMQQGHDFFTLGFQAGSATPVIENHDIHNFSPIQARQQFAELQEQMRRRQHILNISDTLMYRIIALISDDYINEKDNLCRNLKDMGILGGPP